jgi:hypothetical protein
VKSAQQSPYLAIPIFFMEGDETLTALQQMLNDMVGESLKDTVKVPGLKGESSIDLRMNWRLCSDHKLVALFGGFGGSGCNKPCFLCNWDRNDPYSNTMQRTAADTLKKSEWSQKYLKPIHDSAAAVKAAQRKLAVAKKQKRPKAEVVAAAKREEGAARKEQDAAYCKVGKILNEDPHHELVMVLNNASLLQRRSSSLPLKHLKHFEGTAATSMEAEMKAAHLITLENNSEHCEGFLKAPLLKE